MKPYQPDGSVERAGHAGHGLPARATGEDLYRRSLYTFWKRTIPPPMMTNFDAAGREACVVRETRTNTPLQALNLMNDVTFNEAARFIGQRMMKEGGSDAASRLRYGFRLVSQRAADEPTNSACCRATSTTIATTSRRTRRKPRLCSRRAIARGSESEPSGTGRLCVRREPDPESRRGGHDPMSIDPITERKLLLTRRHFFGLGATGIGAAALGIAARTGSARRHGAARAAALPAEGQARHLSVPTRRAVAVGHVRLQAGAEGSSRREPAGSVRKGQRLTGMTAYQTTFPTAPTVFQVRPARAKRDVAQRTAAAHREDRRRHRC